MKQQQNVPTNYHDLGCKERERESQFGQRFVDMLIEFGMVKKKILLLLKQFAIRVGE